MRILLPAFQHRSHVLGQGQSWGGRTPEGGRWEEVKAPVDDNRGRMERKAELKAEGTCVLSTRSDC